MEEWLEEISRERRKVRRMREEMGRGENQGGGRTRRGGGRVIEMGKGSRRVCGGATKRETHADERSKKERHTHTERRGAKKRTAAIRKVKLGPSPKRRISGVAPSQYPISSQPIRWSVSIHSLPSAVK